MALTSESKRNLETLGVTHTVLEPGGFYQGILPGGFTDVTTHIHVPGPKVEFEDEYSKKIKAFREIPEPVQIPHLKVIFEKNDDGVFGEKILEFNSVYKPVHEALMFALQTGVIRYVPDDEMQEKYSDTWTGRSPKLVWRAKSDKPEKSARQFLDEAEQEQNFARNIKNVSAVVKATQNAVMEGKMPPRPNLSK